MVHLKYILLLRFYNYNNNNYHEGLILFCHLLFIYLIVNLHSSVYEYKHNFYCFLCYTGRAINYGKASSNIYCYNFPAGSNSTYPDTNIKITDDMIETTFQMVIIDDVLPFGVEAGHPATIFTNDNDSKCSKMCSYLMYILYISHDVFLRIINLK